MIRGYRWIKSTPDLWMYEGPAGPPRRFHGLVRILEGGSALFCVPAAGPLLIYSAGGLVECTSGYRATVRRAKDEVEKLIRDKE